MNAEFRLRLGSQRALLVPGCIARLSVVKITTQHEHWFTSVAHAQVVIETWRREYNEERPKKGLGGLTPAAYAQQLTARTKAAKVTAGF